MTALPIQGEPCVNILMEKREAADPTMPIRWCINRPAQELIREKGLNHVWLLLSITDDQGKELERQFFPLEQLMGYIQFHQPGKHVFNVVVFGTTSVDPKAPKIVRRRWLRKITPRIYRMDLYGRITQDDLTEFRPKWIEEDSDGHDEEVFLVASSSTEIVVADGFFAKEPAKWVKSWATQIWDNPLRDQCDFRRRLIFAFTIQPILFALWYVWGSFWYLLWSIVRFEVAFFATFLLGVRPSKNENNGVTWRNVFAWQFEKFPWEFWSCWYNETGTWFFGTDSKGQKRPLYWVLGTPIIWVGFYGGTLGWAAYEGHTGADLWVYAVLTLAELLAYIAVVFLSIIVTVAVVWVLIICCARLTGRFLSKKAIVEKFKRIQNRMNDWLERREALRQKKWELSAMSRLKHMERSVDPILCDAGPMPVQVKSLPRERQTIGLRFQAVKARVCRPFAKF